MRNSKQQELDAAILERDTAILAFDAAILERDTAILERDTAIQRLNGVTMDLRQFEATLSKTVTTVSKSLNTAWLRVLGLKTTISNLEDAAASNQEDEARRLREIEYIIDLLSSRELGGTNINPWSEISSMLTSGEYGGIDLRMIKVDPSRPENARLLNRMEELLTTADRLHTEHTGLERDLEVHREHLGTAEAEYKRHARHYAAVNGNLRALRALTDRNSLV